MLGGGVEFGTKNKNTKAFYIGSSMVKLNLAPLGMPDNEFGPP